ncbi:P2 family phage major capsid protein, partial [Endozoicomonas sp. SESOKO4]|uniref:P2 family phage major capsid protein n=1 Tax=Endozoicomonas sp. SESOKO4 TaxID=2828745 RepID=UPI0035A0A394
MVYRTGEISIGLHGDYKNVDALAYDVYSAIPASQRTGSEVCIIGERLVSYDMNKAMNIAGQKPSEKKDIVVLDRTYGGRPAM